MLGEYISVYKETELRLYEFSLLILIYEKDLDFLKTVHDRNFIDYTNGIKFLEFKGYVKQFGEQPTDIMLRKAGTDLFTKHFGKRKKKNSKSEVESWFNEWREIFPEGSNSAGYRYRGNRLEGLKKMIKFVDSYDFTKEEIFEATRQYVQRFAIRGYNYMQQAHYFIEKKDSGSTLASECEGLKEQSDKPSKGPRHGERII